MVNKSIIGATCACLAVGSINVSAIPIEADWKNAYDGLITYDANTGLEWLDLTVTHGLSHDLVTRILGNRELEGLRFATYFEVLTLRENFGGDLHSTGIDAGYSYVPQLEISNASSVATPCPNHDCGLLEVEYILFRIYTYLTGLPLTLHIFTTFVLFLSILLITIGVKSMRRRTPPRRRARKRRHRVYTRHL